MIRKLTEQDLTAIIGTDVNGYKIENARIKGGTFTDSDHYGILLGKSEDGYFATWQFHYDDEELSVYWGHYYMENRDGAVQDFDTRQ
jgi:hypothetical protein